MAYYPLDYGGGDKSGNGYHLTANGTPTFDTGKSTLAATFTDAGSSYFSRSLTTEFDSLTEYSIGFFLKYSDTLDGLSRSSFSLEDTGTGGWLANLYFYKAAGTAHFYALMRQTSAHSAQGIDIDPEDAQYSGYFDGNWHHFLYTVSVTGDEINLYIDGKLIATDNSLGGQTPPSTPDSLKIADGQLDCSIDDVVIYSRIVSYAEMRALSVASLGSDSNIKRLGFADYTRPSDTRIQTGTDNTELSDARMKREAAQSNLMGWWRLNNDAQDWSGNNRHGTNFGADFGVQTVDGRPAARFENVNSDYIAMGDLTVFNFDGDQPFSVACWVNIDSAPTRGAVVGKLNTSNGWILEIDQSLEVLFIHSQAYGTNYIQSLTTGDGLGSWDTDVHVAVTYDGSRQNTGITIYINGAEYTNVNRAGTLTTKVTAYGTVSLTIGRRETDNWYLDGAVEDLRIEDREWTLADVKAIYNNTFIEDQLESDTRLSVTRKVKTVKKTN